MCSVYSLARITECGHYHVMIVYHNAYFLQLCADEEPYLLFASLLGISRADLDGRNNRTIINKTAVGLDYDYQ